MRPNKDRQNLWLWAALLLPLLWLAAGLAQITEQAHGLSALAARAYRAVERPAEPALVQQHPEISAGGLGAVPAGGVLLSTRSGGPPPRRGTRLCPLGQCQ